MRNRWEDEFSGGGVEETLMRRMTDTMVHRGPDDEGFFIGPYVGLGQRRLSIIDLRREATAPLCNEDATVWVVFNGEIYNFMELRVELERVGHRFRTNTDTEVIVHLYEEYGDDCVAHMNGMFAFAIWDMNRNRLFAGRDRLGKKPFYYTNNGSALIFASTIPAIRIDPSVSVSVSDRAIDAYLTCKYVPSPLTVFKEINKLPPGHTLSCDTHGTMRVARYWTPPLVERTLPDREILEGSIIAELRAAVRRRLVSDVPIGAFLSGGIDSGITVALMAMESAERVKTFSIGFAEGDFNELPYARMVADRYGTDHNELVIRPSCIDVLPMLVRMHSEPFADPSVIPTYYVSKATKEYVTVALSGDGGDESFVGYRHYGAVDRWSGLDWIPSSVRRRTFWTMAQVLRRYSHGNTVARIRRACRMAAEDCPGRYHIYMSLLKSEEKEWLYTREFKARIRWESQPKFGLPDYWALACDDGLSPIDWMLRHDKRYYLADCLMTKTDVASMAVSLEVRCPFLDQNVVELMSRLPARLNRAHGEGKALLRNAIKDMLPAEIMERRKSGFAIPVAAWLRGPLRDMACQVLLDERCANRGMFRPDALRMMLDQHISGRRDWSNRLWAFMFLELWLREYVD